MRAAAGVARVSAGRPGEALPVDGHEPTVTHRGRTEARDQPDVPHARCGRARHRRPGRGLRRRVSRGVHPRRAPTARRMPRPPWPHCPRACRPCPSSQDVYRAFHTFLTVAEPWTLNRLTRRLHSARRASDSSSVGARLSRAPQRTTRRMRTSTSRPPTWLAALPSFGSPWCMAARPRAPGEEFILRRVRAGRPRIPIVAGTFLWSRGDVRDEARAIGLGRVEGESWPGPDIAESKPGPSPSRPGNPYSRPEAMRNWSGFRTTPAGPTWS